MASICKTGTKTTATATATATTEHGAEAADKGVNNEEIEKNNLLLLSSSSPPSPYPSLSLEIMNDNDDDDDCFDDNTNEKSNNIFFFNNKIKTKKSQNHQNVIIIICLLYFLYNASISAILPFLSLYFHTIGLEVQTIGLLNSMRSIVTTFASPFWGYVSDLSQRKVDILIIMFVCSTLLRLCIPIVGTDLLLLYIVNLLWVIFHAPVESLMDSMVITAIPEQDRSTFGRYRMFGKIGSLVSSFAGGYIASSPYIFDIAFLVHAVIALPTVSCMIPFRGSQIATTTTMRTTDVVPNNNNNDNNNNMTTAENNLNENSNDNDDNDNDDDGSDSIDSYHEKNKKLLACPGIRFLIRDWNLIYLAIQVFITGFGYGVITTFAYVQFREKADEIIDSDSKMELSFCRLFMTIGGVTMYWNSGYIHNTFGSERVLVMVLFAVSVALFLYAANGLSDDRIVQWLSMLLAETFRGGTYAIFWSSIAVHVHEISPPGTCAAVLTIMESAFHGFGHSAGEASSGFLVAKMDGSTAVVFFLNGIVLLILALLSFLRLVFFSPARWSELPMTERSNHRVT